MGAGEEEDPVMGGVVLLIRAVPSSSARVMKKNEAHSVSELVQMVLKIGDER